MKKKTLQEIDHLELIEFLSKIMNMNIAVTLNHFESIVSISIVENYKHVAKRVLLDLEH